MIYIWFYCQCHGETYICYDFEVSVEEGLVIRAFRRVVKLTRGKSSKDLVPLEEVSPLSSFCRGRVDG